MGNCYCYKKNIPTDIPIKEIKKYVPQIDRGRVVKVYDGDTITIVGYVKNNPELFKFNVRLNNIDCPEMKSKNSKDKTEHKIAVLAQQHVENKILNKIVSLKKVNLDKYGRLLADVYFENELINDSLIKNKLAVKYDGGTKKCPKNWEKFYNDKNN